MRAFPCTLTRCDYRGWQAVHLSNGIVELDIIPQLGGRVMQYRLGSHELFYVNPRHCGRVYSPTENCFEMGWLATMKPADGVALVEKFPLFPEALYPDAAPVEVWVNGEGTFTAHGDK